MDEILKQVELLSQNLEKIKAAKAANPMQMEVNMAGMKKLDDIADQLAKVTAQIQSDMNVDREEMKVMLASVVEEIKKLKIEVPEIAAPIIPEIKIPPIKMPAVIVPEIKIPKIEIPKVEVTFPKTIELVKPKWLDAMIKAITDKIVLKWPSKAYEALPVYLVDKKGKRYDAMSDINVNGGGIGSSGTGGSGGGGAVSIADGDDIATGATADSAYVSGSGSVIAILKGIFGKLLAAGQATMANSSPVVIASNQSAVPIAESQASPTTGTLGALNATLAVTTTTFNSVFMTLVGTFTGIISVEIYDGSAWKSHPLAFSSIGTSSPIAYGGAVDDQIFANSYGAQQIRLKVTAYTSGSLAARIIPSTNDGDAASFLSAGYLVNIATYLLTYEPIIATAVQDIDNATGTTADAAAAAGGTGTLSAKLRKVSADIDSLVTNAGTTSDAAASSGGTGSLSAKIRKISGDIGVLLGYTDGIEGSLVNIDTNAGATGDAAVVTDVSGSISAKLRGLVKIFADVWDSTNHRLLVSSSTRANKVNQQTTINSSVAETTVLTAVASTYLDVYGLIVTNTSATACIVTFKDDTAGTTRFKISVPAGETRGFMLSSDDGHKQAVLNKPWTATCGTSVASIEITVLAVKNT